MGSFVPLGNAPGNQPAPIDTANAFRDKPKLFSAPVL